MCKICPTVVVTISLECLRAKIDHCQLIDVLQAQIFLNVTVIRLSSETE